MSARPPEWAGEIVGLEQSVAYARRLVGQAAEHGPEGNEGYLAHLVAAQLGAAAVDTARQMQEAFDAARAAAQRHADELAKQHGVQAAYDQAPDAGDKPYLQASGAPTPVVETTPPSVDAAAQSARQRRRDLMRHHGIFWCPDWCVQDDDEDQWEDHWGQWRTMTNTDGDEIAVRPRMSWWDSGSEHVEVLVKAHPDSGNPAVYLTSTELEELRSLLDAAEADAEHHRSYDDPSRLIPAYPDAEDDEDGTSAWAQRQQQHPGGEDDGEDDGQDDTTGSAR